MIILFRPIDKGEFVEAGGATGVIEDINIFNTVMKTGDNKTIIVSNSNIIGGNIINYSRKETRRVDITFGIGYDDDLKLAKTTLEEILAADERIISDPAEPFVAVSELGDSSVNLVTRSWVKSGDYWGVYFDTIEKVKLTFDEKGISFPYPQMDIHMDKVEK
jgi:small conductance mechanosensitive channel